MVIPGKTKRILKKVFLAAGLVLAALVIFCVGRFVYLSRYLVYDGSGVHLDYAGNVSAAQPGSEDLPTGDFILQQQAASDDTVTPPTQGQAEIFTGLYFTASQLTDPEITARLPQMLDGVNALMLDMKTATGRYLYDTSLSDVSQTETDLTELIAELDKVPELKLIARIPAFRDSAHALADFSQALPIQGGALWMDANGSYCLDPAGKDVPQYLIDQALELQALGFDEIVFSGFDFPDSQYIRYSRDIPGDEAARQAAELICRQLALFELPVSFISEDEQILMLSHRAYITAQTGDLVSQLVKQYAQILPNGDADLVFLTASRDTRFDSYSVLSPYREDD